MSESEMVERVARVLCQRAHLPEGYGWTPEEIAEFVDDNWGSFADDARAAILAMQEAMVLKGQISMLLQRDGAMSEVIERAARDFALSEGWTWESLHESEDTSFGWGREHIRRRVHTLIRAIREPTEAMANAMIAALGADDDRSGPEIMLDVWQAGINAAL